MMDRDGLACSGSRVVAKCCLCCVIAFLACFHIAVPLPIVAASPHIAEVGQSVGGKSIEIRESTMHIKSNLGIGKIVRRKRNLPMSSPSIPWRDYTNTTGLNNSIKIGMECNFAWADRISKSYICGGNLSKVFNLKINPLLKKVTSRIWLDVHERNSFYHCIGPQLPSSGVISTSHQLVSGVPQPKRISSEKSGYASEDKGDASENPSSNYKPPIARRLALAFLSIVITISVTFLYCDWVIEGHGKRRLIGIAILGAGILCGLIGMGLLFLTGFRWSWGWWV